jgi:aspartate beta-hydroxylase
MTGLQLYDHAVGAVRAIYDRRIDTPPTLDASHYFPNAPRFVHAYPDIRREALGIIGVLHTVPRFHDLMPQQEDISGADGRDWRMFIMKAYGVTVEENLARCPTVAGLLAEAPEAVSCVLSFLAPGKHIPKHRGPFRGILRFHLMLSMPTDAHGVPACELNIDGVPYRLPEGGSLLWDDTYPHEVWNRSDQVRIALLLDVWRRDMPKDVALLSRALMAAAKAVIRVKGVSYGG